MRACLWGVLHIPTNLNIDPSLSKKPWEEFDVITLGVLSVCLSVCVSVCLCIYGCVRTVMEPDLKDELERYPACYDTYSRAIKRLKQKKDGEDDLRGTYETLLEEYPMCYGYWIRLAALQGSLEPLRQGLSLVSANPHFWTAYLEKLADSNEAPKVIRDQMDRALILSGFSWGSAGLWEFCVSYEECRLKSISSSNVEDRHEAEIATARLRDLIFRWLSTPHGKLENAWRRIFTAMGIIGPIELLRPEELHSFQQFAMESLAKESEYACRWRKPRDPTHQSYQQINSNAERTERLCAWLPDGVRFRLLVPQSYTVQDLIVYLCKANTEGVDLIYSGQFLEKDTNLCKSIADEGIVCLFDRPTLAKVLAGADNRLVEQWFVQQREEVYRKTADKVERRDVFERKLRRNYFHPCPLADGQVFVWNAYIDFMHTHGSPIEIDTLYRRCLECCSNYPCIWERYVKYSSPASTAGEDVLASCASKYLKRRSDMHVLFARKLELHGKAEKAVTVLETVINESEGSAPGLLEAYIALLRTYPADSAKMDAIFERGMQTLRGIHKSTWVVERCKYCLRHNRVKAASGLLAKSWESQKDTVLFRYYMELLRTRMDRNYLRIIKLFDDAVACSHLSTVSLWKIWKDYVFFVDHHAPHITTVIQTKDRFFEFLCASGDALQKCRSKRSRPPDKDSLFNRQ